MTSLKYAKKGRMDLFEAQEIKLREYCLSKLSAQKFEELKNNKPELPVKTISNRFVVVTKTEGNTSKLTFAPKTGRIELKITEDDSNLETDYLKLVEILRHTEDFETNLTLRGTIGEQDGFYYCNMRTNNKEFSHKISTCENINL